MKTSEDQEWGNKPCYLYAQAIAVLHTGETEWGLQDSYW